MYLRVVLAEQQTEANSRGHLAVRQVVRNLACRPALVGVRPVELAVRETIQRGRNHFVAFAVAFVSLARVAWSISLSLTRASL